MVVIWQCYNGWKKKNVDSLLTFAGGQHGEVIYQYFNGFTSKAAN
jgi:hypothetical protein